MNKTKEFEGKKILILGALKLVCDIVEHAKAMGAYVVVADYYEDSPAKKIADEAVLMDATDVEAIVKYCQENDIDGVTTGFVDVLLTPCYEVCKRLGLPFYATPKMISMATDKRDFKDTCKDHGVPVPTTYLIGKSIPEELYETIKYPVFVKPMDASGSRGCGVCNNREELDAQFADAVSYSATDNAIIEQYLIGREFLLDYIAVNGEYRLIEMFDRYVCSDRGSAINYANVSVAPSKAIDKYLKDVNPKVIQMFKNLGFTDGLIFLQGHSNGNDITFYEMGCRLGGAFYNVEQACLGMNAIDMVIRYALSGKMVNNIESLPETIAKFNKYGLSCNYLLNHEEGVVKEIKGLDTILNLPSYVKHIQERDLGFHNVKDRTMDKPVFTVHMACENLEKAKSDIKTLNEHIEVLNEQGQSMLMEKFNPDEL